MRMIRELIFRSLRMLMLLALTSAALFPGDWESLSQVSQKQTVTVHTRDGREWKGAIRKVEPDSLTLALQTMLPGGAQAGNSHRFERADIVRVTRKSRLAPAAIGAAILGGATAIGLSFSSSPKDTPQVKAAGTLAFAGVGAAVGAGIGHATTIYDARPRK